MSSDRPDPLPEEIHGLAGECLTAALRAAGQTERLVSLFASDYWVNRRVGVSRAWPGFRDDIELAWEALREDHGRGTQFDSEAIIAAARLAIVSATATDVGQVSPRLVASAHAMGVWSEDRALAEIAAYSTAAARVVGLLALLAHGRVSQPDEIVGRLEVLLIEAGEVSSGAFWDVTRLVDEGVLPRLVDLMADYARFATSRGAAQFEAASLSAKPVTVGEVVTELRLRPLLRRPGLVTKLFDRLLDDVSDLRVEEAAESPPGASEPWFEDGNPNPMMQASWSDGVDALYGADSRREEIIEALIEASGHAELHRDPAALLEGLKGVFAEASDSDLRQRAQRAYSNVAESYGVPWPALDDGEGDSSRRGGQDGRATRRRRLQREILARHAGQPSIERFRAWTLDQL